MGKKASMNKIFFLTCFIPLLLFAFGCKNKKTQIEEMPPIAEQAVEKFTITETEFGKLKMVLESESAVIDEKTNIAVLKLPRIKFYEDGKYSSLLVSETITIDLETYDIKGGGKCSINTAKNENLQTTNLQYDAKRKKIFSNEPIKITRNSETIYGESFESDPDLENIVIRKQRTIINNLN
jgi:LPS export ABC transporter protein LptC